MEVFIKEGDFLLTYYEWCCGEMPKEKVLKDRWKLVRTEKAAIAKHPEDAKVVN
jgi:hypothetical protein